MFICARFLNLAPENQSDMFTELIITVAKWVFIGLAVLCILAGIFVKSKDVHVDNDPTHFPPVF